MNTTQANTSIKSLNTELFNLTPTSPIYLFEIDVSNLYFDETINSYQGQKIFRFHNNVKLFNNNIIFGGVTYYAAPIMAEGFEYSAKGSLPTPKLSISVRDENINELRQIRLLLKNINELTGAKVTRRKTYAMFLDEENWILNGGTPAGFSPDPYAEFTPDIYYINRKSADNKNYLEFELTSIIDLEGLKLPGRLVLADRCVAVAYRGEGCLYEYGGDDGQSARYDNVAHKDGILPKVAPPIANYKDEKFTTLLGLDQNESLNDRDAFSMNNQYNKGDFFYVTKNHIKYYYVVRKPAIGITPPNAEYYYSDECSRTVNGCRLRYPSSSPDTNPNSILGPNRGALMFNGFPSVNKVG